MAEQQGMFGPSAEMLQRALMEGQQTQDFERARMFGQMGLGQQIGTAAYGGGLGITRGLEQLGQGFGIIPEDPRIAEARKLMEVKKGIQDANIDPSDIDNYYPEMIRRLNAAGFPEQANRAMQQYTQVQTAQETLETRKAEAEARNARAAGEERLRTLPGTRLIPNLVQSIQAKPENAAIVQQYARSIDPANPWGDIKILDQLGLVDKKLSPKKPEYFSGGLPVYTDEKGTYQLISVIDPKTKDTNFLRKYGTYSKDAGTPAVQVTNIPESKKQEMEFGARLAISQPAAKAFATKNALAYESQDRVSSLVSLAQNAPLLLGSFADQQTAVSSFLNTLGVKGFSENTTTSQVFDTLVGPEILSKMQQLGGQDSNEELRKITSLSPNRSMTRPALVHTSKVLQAEVQRQLQKDRNYQSYLATPGASVADFNFSSGFMPGQPNPNEMFPVPVIDPETLVSYPSKAAYQQAVKQRNLKNIPTEELLKRRGQ
jgi:hypothetical protein